MAGRRDFYEVLGVPRDAPAEDIQRSYRKLARTYHPDVNKDPSADERFKEIADHKKTVTAADLEAIAADEVGSFEGKFVLESFRVVAATGRQSRAAVTISHAEHGTFEAEAEGERVVSHPEIADTPAVRNRNAFAVDATSFFSRPGPRIVDGLEILVQQGARSLEIWTGRRPDLDVMREAAARR